MMSEPVAWHSGQPSCRAVCTPLRLADCNKGNAVHAVRIQCKVLHVGDYRNASFGPFVQVFCSRIGVFELLMHSGHDMFGLLSIVTYFHLFVLIFTHLPFG